MVLPPGLQRFRTVWERDIWLATSGRDRSVRGRFYALLRVISITISGLREIHVAARAAALSYSSLLGLGPLVAIAVLISGFALGGSDPQLVANTLNRAIRFIAPHVAQFEKARETVDEPALGVSDSAPSSARAPAAASRPADPVLVQLINNFIASSRSGTAGAVGLLTLLLIVIQLFTTVENTFNDIWGVRRGRSWLTRVVYYWTTVTLGAVLFFASVTLFGAGMFATMSKDLLARLPFGAELAALVRWTLPSLSALMLVLLLTLFYRAVPNTRVMWRAALAGAVMVTALLFLNNLAAFLYVKTVLRNMTLYGSLVFPIVLMIGLYTFWLLVLVGGQLTYAVQNVHYRSSQAAWHSINETTREGLSLLVLVLIARRFKDCAPACSATELSHLIRVPTQILNESLNRLCDLRLITELPPGDGRDPTDHRYQPARPLDKITLGQFKRLFATYGDAPSGDILASVDPVLQHYQDSLAAHLDRALGTKSLDELLGEFPVPAARSAPAGS
jgi:membrane protein